MVHLHRVNWRLTEYQRQCLELFGGVLCLQLIILLILCQGQGVELFSGVLYLQLIKLLILYQGQCVEQPRGALCLHRVPTPVWRGGGQELPHLLHIPPNSAAR